MPITGLEQDQRRYQDQMQRQQGLSELQDNRSIAEKMLEGVAGYFNKQQAPTTEPRYMPQARQLQESVNREALQNWLDSTQGQALQRQAAEEYAREQGM